MGTTDSLISCIWCFLFCINWIEYGFLIYGVHRYFSTSKNWANEFKRRLTQATKDFVLKTPLKLAAIVTGFILFLAISISPSALYVAYDTKTNQYDKQHVPAVIAHFLTVAVCIMMTTSMATCGAVWSEVKISPKEAKSIMTGDNIDEQKEEERELPEEGQGDRWVICSDINYPYKKQCEYKTKVVQQIYKIYSAWFILHLLHYLMRVLFDLAQILRPLMLNNVDSGKETMHDLLYIHYGLYYLYDIQSIIIPYLVALKMNSFLRHYIRKQQKEQLKQAKTRSVYTALNSILSIEITEDSNSYFVPRIPGTGINIPL